MNKATSKGLKYSRLKLNDHRKYIGILNPLWQTTLWIGALFWGAAASLLANDILSFVIPSSYSDFVNLPIHWHSVGFLATALLLTFLFSVSRWVSISQDRLIIDSLLTIPPHDFWIAYGESYADVSYLIDRLSDEALGKVDDVNSTNEELTLMRETMEENVRVILDCVINLTKKWDASNLNGSSIVYRANLMKVYYFDDANWCKNTNREELIKLAQCFSTYPTEQHYSGVVALENNKYTTATDTPKAVPDNRKPIAFPFALASDFNKDGIITANLMGAPVAISSGHSSYVYDTTTIAQHYSNNNSLIDMRVAKELESYYKDNINVASSILSISIKDMGNNKVNYVMNIYRNQTGLLFGGEKVKDFIEIIKPYSIALSRLLASIELFDELRAYR